MREIIKRQEKLLGVMNRFIFSIVVMNPWLCRDVKTFEIIQSKYVQFAVGQLSLNETF